MNQKPSRGCTVHFPFTHLPYSKYSSDTLTQFVPRGVSNLLLSLSQCFFWPPSFTQTRHLHLVSFEPFFLLALLPETFLPIARDCLDFPPFPDMFSDDHFNLWHTWTLSMLSIYKPLFPFLDPLSFFLPLPPAPLSLPNYSIRLSGLFLRREDQFVFFSPLNPQLTPFSSPFPFVFSWDTREIWKASQLLLLIYFLPC